MGFAADFAAHVSKLTKDLNEVRAPIVDAMFEMLAVAGFDMSLLTSDQRDVYTQLANDLNVIEKDIEQLQWKAQVYRAREENQKRERAREKRKADAARRAERITVAAQVNTNHRASGFAVSPQGQCSCSLAGAEPPWKWNWSDRGGYTQFSDMKLVCQNWVDDDE